MDQYNQPGGIEGTVPVPTRTPTTKTATEIKLDQLQETVHSQNQEIMKLHRDISRLKNAVSDLENIISRRRGQT
jgi:predicted RNase H-like nuclease (RuvC/YqgF family)